MEGRSKLDQAKEAVQSATSTVRITTQTIADAIEAGRQLEAPVDRLVLWTRSGQYSACSQGVKRPRRDRWFRGN